MRYSRILITGATGFIGSRLCEKLTLHYRLPYRALVQNYGRAAQSRGLVARWSPGTWLIRRALRRRLRAVDAVVHLAFGNVRKPRGEPAGSLRTGEHEAVCTLFFQFHGRVHGPQQTPQGSPDQPGSQLAHLATKPRNSCRTAVVLDQRAIRQPVVQRKLLAEARPYEAGRPRDQNSGVTHNFPRSASTQGCAMAGAGHRPFFFFFLAGVRGFDRRDRRLTRAYGVCEICGAALHTDWKSQISLRWLFAGMRWPFLSIKPIVAPQARRAA